MKTEREEFYRIDPKGSLWHGETELDDEGFIEYFFKQLRENATGRNITHAFVSRLGAETAFLKAADTPVVFKKLVDNKLYYTENLFVDFQPGEFRFSDEGVLYHPAPIGEHGKIASQLIMQLSNYIRPWGPYFSFKRPEDQFENVIEPLEKKDDTILLKPRPENRCAGCGGANPNGLGLTFLYDGKSKTVKSWLIPDSRLEGSLGWMHGGYVSLLLDEVMGKVLSTQKIKAATAQLNVRFRKPVILQKEIELKAEMEKQSGRKNFVRGKIHDAETGTLLAEAVALFISVEK